MTPEQQRKMLECAAKACGVECEIEQFSNGRCFGTNQYNEIVFDPLTNPADTAEMCAKLGIGNRWYLLDDFVVCGPSYNNVAAYFKHHDNSSLKSWMFAATMCAAKTQGMKNESLTAYRNGPQGWL